MRWVWSLFLLGCADRTEELPEIGQWSVAEQAQSASILDVVGKAPLRVEYRLLTSDGIPSAGEDVVVTVNSVPVESEVDSHGYGVIELDEAGEYDLVVGGEQASAWVVGEGWNEPSLPRSFMSSASDIQWVEPMNSGTLLGSPSGVWWMGPTGSYAVFDPQGWLIRGLRVGHLDDDALLDALVWTDNELVLFRGRDGGGLSLGARLGDPDYAISGAVMGDLSEDGSPDVAVAWRGQSQHWLSVFEGNGNWTFSPTPLRPLNAAPVGIDIGFNTSRMHPEVTITNEDGRLERYTLLDSRRYIPVGPSLATEVPAQSWVESGHDLNGDGADEVVLLGPLVEDASREVYIFDLLPKTPVYLLVDQPVFNYAFADITGDGVDDLLQMFEDGELQAFFFGESGYGQQRVSSFGEPSPMGVADQNGDGGQDLLLAGEQNWVWRWGETSSDGKWSELDAPFQSLGVNQYDGFIGLSTNGNVEFARVYAGSGMTLFTRYSIIPGVSQRPEETGSTVLSYSELDVLDSAACDDIVWVLLDGLLLRLNLQGASPTVTGTLSTDAERVTCGAGPSNAKAAVLLDGEVMLLDNALNPEGMELTAGAQDIAFGRIDGQAVLGTCSSVGCEIEPWYPLEMQGDSVWVIGGESVRVTDDDEFDVTYDLGASVRLGDVDGDGTLEVLLHKKNGVIGLLRGLGAPLELWTSPKSWDAFVWAADIDGDDSPELWVVDQIGDIGLIDR